MGLLPAENPSAVGRQHGVDLRATAGANAVPCQDSIAIAHAGFRVDEVDITGLVTDLPWHRAL